MRLSNMFLSKEILHFKILYINSLITPSLVWIMGCYQLSNSQSLVNRQRMQKISQRKCTVIKTAKFIYYSSECKITGTH